MHRSPLDDLRQIEGEDADPGLASATLVKLIYASREFGTRVYDCDPRTGTYVVVLEGVLEISEREDAPVPMEPAAAEDAAEPATTPNRQESVAMDPFRGGGGPGTGG